MRWDGASTKSSSWRNGTLSRLGNALTNSVETYNKFLGSIEGKQGGSVFFLGRELGELVHSDQELAEVPEIKPELRGLESREWSQPLLAGPPQDAPETKQ